MHMRYLLALAILPALAATAAAQAPDPLSPPPPPPGAAPAPAPDPVPPPPAQPEAVAPPAGDTPAPALGEGPPAAVLSATPDVINGIPPRQAGDDAVASGDGPVGLLRVSAAQVGSLFQLRMGIHGRYFSANNVLIDKDRDMRLQGGLAVAFTPLRFLEVFAAVSGSANRNQRLCGPVTRTVMGRMETVDLCVSEAGRNDPEVIKSYGDLSFGTKFAYPLSGGISAGAEVGLRFLSSVSGISFNSKATSVWLSGLSTYDMKPNLDLPLQLHLNLGLYFDNSGEVQSYQGISRPSKAVSQFAYGIAKDRVRGALGAEWLFEQPKSDFALRPFVEYHLEMITSAPDPAFSDFRPPVCRDNGPPGSTACRDNRDQQWMSLGLRVQIKRTFTIIAGVDLALHSVGFPYGPPLPPYEVILGFATTFDTAAPRYVTKTVVLERKIAGDRPIEGYAAGKVLAAPAGKPIEGAIVAVAGRPRSRVATDPDGSFKTAGLPVGLLDLEVSAPGFEAASVRTSIAAGQEAPVAVTLTPRVKSGKVTGKITDDKGKALSAATVKFSGPQNAEVKTDDTGAFTTSLPGGAYVVRIEADKHFGKELRLELTDGKEEDVSATVRAKPTVSRVTVKDGRISIRAGISFKGSELTPASVALLDELADALISHPEIRKIRIETHWDTSLPADKAKELTEQQGQAVAAHLAKQGVPPDRMEVTGMGAARPIVPNIGMAKLRNRRVEIRASN
jgi:outer membrane protein OmpA-like peptidoglycan-associated protein